MSLGAGSMLISSDNCQGADLGWGASCTTNVRFSASHYGDYSGILISAELRADAGLRSPLVAKLGTAATIDVPQSALTKGKQLLKANGIPASIAAILKAFGVSRASIAALAGQTLPSHVTVALPNAGQIARTEQATAGVLQTAARKLLAS